MGLLDIFKRKPKFEETKDRGHVILKKPGEKEPIVLHRPGTPDYKGRRGDKGKR